ncbi:MAG: hypothetical protein WBM35_07625, partial [Candidatus Electrothrix sp.]
DYSIQPRMLPDSTEGKILQAMYSVGSSPNGMNHAEEKRFSATTYNQAQEKYHFLLQNYLREFRFYDFFIIDSETGVIREFTNNNIPKPANLCYSSPKKYVSYKIATRYSLNHGR